MCSANSAVPGAGPSKMTSAPTCMCDACFSWCRKEASIALKRSLWPCCPMKGNLTGKIAYVKLLGTVLALQVLLGLVLVGLVATDNVPFVDDDADGAATLPERPKVDHFDSAAAWKLLREQVELGPRPAGSATSL